ncbi:MAG: hypothetical protein PHD02_04600 [Bacilli bacterium]|nr:hypothetical protein [Bacilli bacterium]
MSDDFMPDEDELFEDDLEQVRGGYVSRVEAIKEELRNGRLYGTLTPDKEQKLMEELNQLQGIDYNSGRSR